MFDAENCFTLQTDGTYDQDFTAEAISTSVIDLGNTGIDLANPARPIYIVIRVGTAVTTSVSVEIKLINDSTVDLATSEKEIAMWRFTLANLTAGKLLVNQMIPVGTMQYQYLGLQITPFTNAGAGSLFAFLTDSPETAESHVELVQAAS